MSLIHDELRCNTVFAVLVLIFAGLAVAFNYHLAALAEVFADELCGIAPRCKAEPINLTVAILVCLAAVNSHAKARDRNAALCGPKFRISSKPTLKIAAIQH